MLARASNHPDAAATTATSVDVPHQSISLFRDGGGGLRTLEADRLVQASGESRTIRASPIAGSGFFTSGWRQRARRCRIRWGVVAGSDVQSIWSRKTAATISLTDSPAKRGLPVSISKQTTPNAQMSVRV